MTLDFVRNTILICSILPSSVICRCRAVLVVGLLILTCISCSVLNIGACKCALLLSRRRRPSATLGDTDRAHARYVSAGFLLDAVLSRTVGLR